MTRCGLYDSDFAVWDDVEAYVLINGRWHAAEAFKMWHEARINVEAAFMRQLKAGAPPLPDGAFARNAP